MLGSELELEIKVTDPRLHEWGLPTYQTELAAGIDLHACIDAPLAIEPQAPAQLVSSGLAVLMNEPNMAALVLPRSGLGHKRGLVLGNSVGLIDADWTAPIAISVWSRLPPGSDPIIINPGDRIAQLVFVPILRPRFRLVAAFSAETRRGDRGFGSTGR
ncbi:MAG TPA: dUTP diphosphatase [Stellaceae bacterium]|nr:dUTP diphosphatase [Stellaceae bacterium]